MTSPISPISPNLALLHLTYPSLTDLEGAIDKSDLLIEENQSRWPANSVDGTASSLWSLAPEEVAREQNAQMAHD
jgi:beta-1,4-N-acetylglucosaminyltransferase